MTVDRQEQESQPALLTDDFFGALQREYEFAVGRPPELFFGLVRTLGSDTSAVVQELKSTLAASGYRLYVVKLSQLLKAPPAEPGETEPERYERLMDAGDRYRSGYGRPEAVAINAVRHIRHQRLSMVAENSDVQIAWLFDALMHPDEVRVLRQIYGKRLFVISCDSPRHYRHQALRAKFRRRSGLTEHEADMAALHAINRDAGTASSKKRAVSGRHRLAVGKTLELGDVFVRADEPQSARRVVRRLVQLILDHPFHTPTLDEIGMALAFQAALATATLSRRVGAAIMVDEQICAIGTNEVPKFGGGVYHAESNPDAREFVQGYDPSDPSRAQLLADLLHRLQQEGWLKEELSTTGVNLLVERAIGSKRITDSELFDVLEYGRTAHAEAVAITSAAARGVSIRGGTLFSTTMPCHECTRAIVAAGLHRVVYLEPYAKSRGPDLQSDSVALVAHHGVGPNRVTFDTFAGIAYSRFPDLFSWRPRKQDDILRAQNRSIRFDGSAVTWEAWQASLRPSIFPREFADIEILSQVMKEQQMVILMDRIESTTPRESERGNTDEPR